MHTRCPSHFTHSGVHQKALCNRPGRQTATSCRLTVVAPGGKCGGERAEGGGLAASGWGRSSSATSCAGQHLSIAYSRHTSCVRLVRPPPPAGAASRRRALAFPAYTRGAIRLSRLPATAAGRAHVYARGRAGGKGETRASLARHRPIPAPRRLPPRHPQAGEGWAGGRRAAGRPVRQEEGLQRSAAGNHRHEIIKRSSVQAPRAGPTHWARQRARRRGGRVVNLRTESSICAGGRCIAQKVEQKAGAGHSVGPRRCAA